MAKKPELHLLISALISALAGTGILMATLTTNFWVQSDLHDVVDVGAEPGYINYGLFSGYYERVTLVSREVYPMILTCLTDPSICAFSCRDTPEARVEEVQELYEKGTAQFMCKSPGAVKTLSKTQRLGTSTGLDESMFINFKIWISTIAFISIGGLFGTIGAGFLIYNMCANPISAIAGIFGLRIWFGIAALSDALALILWGSQFGTTLVNNVAISETLSGTVKSQGFSYLGWSYWALLTAFIEFSVIFLVLYIRDRRLNKPDENSVVQVENQDNADILY